MTPPITTSDVRSPYFGQAVITLTPVDPVVTGAYTSGVAATHYTVDGVPNVGTVITIAPPQSQSATHTVSYWSADNAGNNEVPTTYTITVGANVDTTPPTTTRPTPRRRTRCRGLITLTAQDNQAAGASPPPTTSSMAPPVSRARRCGPAGPGYARTSSTGRSTLPATRETTESASYSVTASDTTPPTTTSNVQTSTPYMGQANIVLTATDNSGVTPTTYWILDGGAQTTGTTLMVAPPASGTATHTIQFWSVDVNGNQEATNSQTFTMLPGDAHMGFSNYTPARGATGQPRNPVVSVTATTSGLAIDPSRAVASITGAGRRSRSRPR